MARCGLVVERGQQGHVLGPFSILDIENTPRDTSVVGLQRPALTNETGASALLPQKLSTPPALSVMASLSSSVPVQTSSPGKQTSSGWVGAERT